VFTPLLAAATAARGSAAPRAASRRDRPDPRALARRAAAPGGAPEASSLPAASTAAAPRSGSSEQASGTPTGSAYLQQRGIPLALAQQCGVGYAAPGRWPHAARDWKGGRVVFPHTTPDGRLVNLYGRAVGTAEQVPKAKRHDHLRGAKGYFNATALQAGAGPLWMCEGAFDALALLAAGVSRVVAIFGVQGWRWAWVLGGAGGWAARGHGTGWAHAVGGKGRGSYWIPGS